MRRWLLIPALLVLYLPALAATGAKGEEDNPLNDPQIVQQIVVNSATPGGISGTWSGGFLQDSSLSLGSVRQCNDAVLTTCAFQTALPSTTGSIATLGINTGNNVTISSITWDCGGTWQTAGVHIWDGTNNQNQDVFYNTTSTSGGCGTAAHPVNITISGAPGSWTSHTLTHAGIFPVFDEQVCPSGAGTCVLDQVATQQNASCNSACTLPSFTGGNALTAIDWVLIVGMPKFSVTNVATGAAGGGTYNGYGAPYRGIYGGNYSDNGIAENIGPGAVTGATAEMCSVASGCPSLANFAHFAALAFKSNPAIVTISPPNIWSVGNMQLLSATVTACSPTCTYTIPSTVSGDGWLLVSIPDAAGTGVISSCSVGASSCTVRTGANTCQMPTLATVGRGSCAYITSLPAAGTSASITMSASASYFLGAYEFTKVGGGIAFDTDNSTSVGVAANTPTGQALTLTGTNDIVFQIIAIHGGVANQCIQSASFIPFPYNAYTNCTGQVYGSTTYNGAAGFAVNVGSVPANQWAIYNGLTSVYEVAAVAFK